MNYADELETIKGQQAEILQMLKPMFSSPGKKVKLERSISVAQLQRKIIQKHNQKFDVQRK